MGCELGFISLGDLATVEMGQSPDSSFVSEDANGLPFLQGNAEFGSIYPNARLHCERPNKLCKPGDVLISVRAPVGALNKADRIYCIGRGLAVVRFVRVTPEFGWHLLNFWGNALQRTAQGSTFEAVTKADLQSLRVYSFPLPEQQRIAEILDTIDEAIRQTEALIAKLKQIKSGLLHDLLTCGIDENGQLRDPARHPEQFKDSEVGRIPVEWEVNSLGAVCARGGGSIQTGPFGSQLHARDYTSEGVPIITVEDLGENTIFHNNLSLVGEKDYRRLLRYRLQTGDLVFSRVGAIDRCAYVSEAEDGWLFSGSCLRVRVGDDSIRPRFLSLQLNSRTQRQWILNHSVGSTRPSLNTSILSCVPILLPPPHEQEGIISVLDSLDSRGDAEQEYRDKLLSIKQGLMDDLLTGRVRVAVLAGSDVHE